MFLKKYSIIYNFFKSNIIYSRCSDTRDFFDTTINNIHFNIAGYFNYDHNNIVPIYATNNINIPD